MGVATLASFGPVAAQDAELPTGSEIHAQPAGDADGSSAGPMESGPPPDQTDGRQRAAAVAAASFGSIPGLFVRGIEPGFWVEVGVARHDARPLGSGRAMLGVTAALDPQFFTLGVVGDYSGIDGFAVGGGLDYLAAAPGVFATFAALADPGDAAQVSGTIGWQVFAVDVQHRVGHDHPGTIVFFKLRAPVSWVVRTLVQR